MHLQLTKPLFPGLCIKRNIKHIIMMHGIVPSYSITFSPVTKIDVMMFLTRSAKNIDTILEPSYFQIFIRKHVTVIGFIILNKLFILIRKKILITGVNFFGCQLLINYLGGFKKGVNLFVNVFSVCYEKLPECHVLQNDFINKNKITEDCSIKLAFMTSMLYSPLRSCHIMVPGKNECARKSFLFWSQCSAHSVNSMTWYV